MKKIVAAGLMTAAAALASAGTAHADNTSDFLDAAHGRGRVLYNQLVVPGGDAELVSLAKIACTTYATQGGMAAIAAVRAAQPTITFRNKDPMLIPDAPTLLELHAVNHYCPWV